MNKTLLNCGNQLCLKLSILRKLLFPAVLEHSLVHLWKILKWAIFALVIVHFVLSNVSTILQQTNLKINHIASGTGIRSNDLLNLCLLSKPLDQGFRLILSSLMKLISTAKLNRKQDANLQSHYHSKRTRYYSATLQWLNLACGEFAVTMGRTGPKISSIINGSSSSNSVTMVNPMNLSD